MKVAVIILACLGVLALLAVGYIALAASMRD